MKYLILTEKPSAMQNFAKALGGQQGHFDNFDYQLVHAHGHLMGLDAPQAQLSDINFQDRVKQWSDTSTIPWRLNQFKWVKTYLPSIDYRTKRKTTTKKDVLSIKSEANGCDAIVIATDDDPSGEGDVLGQEIVNAINWRGKILRCRFADESKPSIQKAMSDLDDVTDTVHNGNYQKGLARERFDYATMQLSRLATKYAREQSYDVVIRPGRLKSTIVVKTYQQAHDRAVFKPKDQFQAIFEDENGTKFVDSKMNKYDQRDLAENDMQKLHESPVVVDKTERKHDKAPKLLDFAQVGVVLSKTHAKLSQIVATYQKMYEAGYVSYPRTDDRAMTVEQWNQLLNIADTIAQVVGVDTSLLVQKDPRSPYVSNKDLSHGANRPGLTVPDSLDDLSNQFGSLGAAIYETLAKSYLATLAPDYEYDATTAFIQDFPQFTAHKNVPVKQGYKQILGSIETSTKDEKKNEGADTQFGKIGKPAISQSKTTPPAKPTRKFMLNYLTKNNVGTGATRMNTLATLLDGKHAVLQEKKGELQLTPEGMLAGAILQGTMLSSPKVTKQLSEMTKQVGEFKIPIENIYRAVNMIITSDDKLMHQNAQRVDNDTYLKGKLPKKQGNSQSKFHGKLKDGTEVSFKRAFMGHEFTQEEADALLAGNTIKIPVQTKYGKKEVTGSLKYQQFKGKDGKLVKYWGFKANWK